MFWPFSSVFITDELIIQLRFFFKSTPTTTSKRVVREKTHQKAILEEVKIGQLGSSSIVTFRLIVFIKNAG
jgi:hypothetical protein